MQKVDLYRYEDNGTVIITPNARAETDTPSRMRLIADENCTLTNGTTETPAVDIMLDEVDLWTEVEVTTETPTEIEAAEAEKAHAYDILTGVIE
jgi:hypothetical protein